jgi:aromatic ring-cleaving dioxygenase
MLEWLRNFIGERVKVKPVGRQVKQKIGDEKKKNGPGDPVHRITHV